MIAAKTKLFEHVVVMSSYGVIYLNMGDFFLNQHHYTVIWRHSTVLIFNG